MQYLFLDTWDIDNRVNNVNWLMRGPISDGQDVKNKLSRLYHPAFANTGYYNSLKNQLESALSQCQRAKNLMALIDAAGETYKECEDILKKFFDEFDLYSVALENQIREDLGMESINTVDGQKVENIAKVVIGVAVITVGAVCTVASGGSLAGFMIPALIGAGSGTLAGGIEAALSGESIVDGMADGFLSGSISGTISGTMSISAKVLGLGKTSTCILKASGEAATVIYETGIDALSGEIINKEDMLKDIGLAVLFTGVDELADIGGSKVVKEINKIPGEKLSEPLEKMVKVSVKVRINTTAKIVMDEDYRSSFTEQSVDVAKTYTEEAFKYYLKID